MKKRMKKNEILWKTLQSKDIWDWSEEEWKLLRRLEKIRDGHYKYLRRIKWGHHKKDSMLSKRIFHKLEGNGDPNAVCYTNKDGSLVMKFKVKKNHIMGNPSKYITKLTKLPLGKILCPDGTWISFEDFKKRGGKF